ncbi:MAG: 60S ribosomal protein L32, partial [Paramarteilia canceri]
DLNLVWFNKTFSAVIRHGVSSKNRKLIVEEAKKKGIRVENSKARMISQPNAVQAEEAKS